MEQEQENYVDSIIQIESPAKQQKRVKTIDLKLGLIYPELPTKYYALAPLPRPKKVGPASLLAWLLYSNKMYLNPRWFDDHSDFWAKNALTKLIPITRFFHLIAMIRPTIQRTWIKVLWIIIRLLFAILTIIGVVGTIALGSSETWESQLVTGLLGTGLGFLLLNISFIAFSFLMERLFNKKWNPKKNKRFICCLKELVFESKKKFKCDLLKININVLLFDQNETFGIQKISNKSKKTNTKLEKELFGWKSTLQGMVDFIHNNIKDLIIETPISYVSIKTDL